MSTDPALTAAERQRTLAAHMKVMGDRWWVTTTFELRNICAEMGLQPTLEEMESAIEVAGGRLDFAGLLHFVLSCKLAFYAPEPRDADTVRAFVAVGGAGDKTGSVDCERLRQTCARFSLSVDIDGIFAEADTDGGDSLEFREFCTMLDSRMKAGDPPGVEQSRSPALALGFDYQTMLSKEREELAGRHRPSIKRSESRVRGRSFVTRHLRSASQALPLLDDGTRNSRLRNKGVNAALWGGDEAPSATCTGPDMAGAGGKKRGRRANGRKSPQEGEAVPGGGLTHAVGRRGLLVDDPPLLPRHYPQQIQQQQAGAVQLPRLASPRGRQRLGPLKRERAESPPALAGIERRIMELGSRRLGRRYLDVQPRVNMTGSVFTGLDVSGARSAPTPARAMSPAPSRPP